MIDKPWKDESDTVAAGEGVVRGIYFQTKHDERLRSPDTALDGQCQEEKTFEMVLVTGPRYFPLTRGS